MREVEVPNRKVAPVCLQKSGQKSSLLFLFIRPSGAFINWDLK